MMNELITILWISMEMTNNAFNNILNNYKEGTN